MIEPARPQGGNVSDFAYESKELDAMAEAHNYYAAIVARFSPHLTGHVLEVGAGVGTFAARLLDGARLDRLDLVEPASNHIPLLQRRFADDARVRLIHGYLEDLPEDEQVDTVVAVNVLEHVPDDLAFLTSARRRLRPAGTLLLYVPALPAIYGRLDAAFGHYRRYSRDRLQCLLTEAGFQVEDLRYTNPPGVLGWWIAGRLLGKRNLNPREVRLYDRWITPAVVRLERRWNPLLGQSLIAICRR